MALVPPPTNPPSPNDLGEILRVVTFTCAFISIGLFLCSRFLPRPKPHIQYTQPPRDPLHIRSEQLRTLSKEIPFVQEVARKLDANAISQETRDLLFEAIPNQVDM